MLKKALNALSTVVLVFMVMFAILLAGPYLIGLKTYAVISGSMEPALKVGCLAYVKPAEPSEIKKGDIITFLMEGSSMVATHRVVDINTAEQTFTTKGDANENKDAPIGFDRLIGKTLFGIPYLGYPSMFMKTKKGIVLALCFLTMMILLSLIPKIIGKVKPQSSKQ